MSNEGILFVDDDPGVLSSLRRMMHPLRTQWRMSFAISGAEALDMLSKAPYDVIISDMRMPEMNGAQLLCKVKLLYPHMARMILSGHSERELAVQTINVAHQFLNKPCDLDELTRTINKTISLRKLLSNPDICKLANDVVKLPSIPEHYLAITKEFNQANPSIDKVNCIIESDPAMSISVLRLANSGFFGLQNRITSVREAIGQLGLELLRRLSLAMEIFAKYESTPNFSIEEFSYHSTKVGSYAQTIATKAKASKSVRDSVLISAMLSDVGILMLNTTIPAKYEAIVKTASENGEDLIQTEKRILGASHADLGAYMMGLWGFDDDIVEAIAYHHNPELATHSSVARPLAFVHVANALIPCCHNKLNGGCINESFLKSCGLIDYLSEWKTLANSFNSVEK